MIVGCAEQARVRARDAIRSLEGRWADSSADPKVRQQVAGLQAVLERQAKAIQESIPTARVVQLPSANHYVFLSNEADVLREMRAFVRGLR